MSLCQYKHSLGVPGEGFHAARLGPFALWDVLGTVAGGVALSYATDWPMVYSQLAVFAVGHVLHLAFCVDTAAVRMLHGA